MNIGVFCASDTNLQTVLLVTLNSFATSECFWSFITAWYTISSFSSCVRAPLLLPFFLCKGGTSSWSYSFSIYFELILKLLLCILYASFLASCLYFSISSWFLSAPVRLSIWNTLKASSLIFALMLVNCCPYDINSESVSLLFSVLKSYCYFLIYGGQYMTEEAAGRPLDWAAPTRFWSSSNSEASSYVLMLLKSSVWMDITRVQRSGTGCLPRLLWAFDSSSLSGSSSSSSELWWSPSSLSSSRMYICILLVRTFWFRLIFVLILIEFSHVFQNIKILVGNLFINQKHQTRETKMAWFTCRFGLFAIQENALDYPILLILGKFA